MRDLHSLENLAHCDVICLDKTGTLTQGSLQVEKVCPMIEEEAFQTWMATYLQHTEDNNGTYQALKDHFPQKAGYPVTGGVPFSSERKWSTVTAENGQTLVLGAPEKLCGHVPPEIMESMAQGKRILWVGLCSGEIEPAQITPIGMIVLADKLRETAPKTIQYFYEQDVAVKIISGDNPVSAAAVAKRSGIQHAEQFVDVSRLSEAELAEAAENYTVFGRATPAQKKQLIAALQKNGHRVAMTGDGVNDLLAMRQADCSAAMGNGSDAAKQTAQLVLLDSDFSVLKDVVAEGRRVINNLTKSAGVFFIKTIYSVLLCMLCLLFDRDFPFIPIQVTLIDAVIEGFPAFFMSFERNDKKVEGTFLDSTIRSALPNSIAIFVCCTAIWLLAPHIGLGSAQSSLLMYWIVGFISLTGVIKASTPFNLFHGFLAGASILGFVCAVAWFAPFLQLPHLTPLGAMILPFIAIPGVIFAAVLKFPHRPKK